MVKASSSLGSPLSATWALAKQALLAQQVKMAVMVSMVLTVRRVPLVAKAQLALPVVKALAANKATQGLQALTVQLDPLALMARMASFKSGFRPLTQCWMLPSTLSLGHCGSSHKLEFYQ